MTILSRRSVLAAGASVLTAACGKTLPAAPSLFDGFEGAAGAELLAAEPEYAEAAGIIASDALDDRSADGVDLKRAAALRRLAQLRAIDRASLDERQKATFDAFDAQGGAVARGAAFDFGRFGPVTGFAPYAIDHVGAGIITLPGHLNLRAETMTLAEMPAHLQRLRAVAASLDAETARVRAESAEGVTPPGLVLGRAAAIAAALGARAPEESGFITPLRRRVEALAGPPDAAALPDQAKLRAALGQAIAIVGNNILPACRRAAQALADLSPRAGQDLGVWRLPRGDEYYAATLAFHTSTAAAPAAVHQLGLDRGRAVQAQLDMMLRSQGLTEGTPGERLAKLTADPQFHYPPTIEASGQLLAEAMDRVKRATAQLSRWFAAPPGARLDVRAWDEGAPFRVYQPASPDGKRPAALYLDVRDPTALARFDLATWAHREGLPGRHLATVQTLARADLPALRRVLYCPAFIDGWASYAEQLADEMGLFDNDPYSRIGYLRAQAWAAARVVVDTGIHFGRWTADQARAYLFAATGDTPAAIERELARSTAVPGLGCAAELGRLEFLRLRDRARTALGAKFDIRDFHSRVLAEGQLPPPALARHVELWIASGGGK